METPVIDFAKTYAEAEPVRAHMPGHKGVNKLGFESLDLTEIAGADSLFEADGILAFSEAHLTKLFGTKASFYSAEGSSLCIRAMLYLTMLSRMEIDSGYRSPWILAARNSHKVFLQTCSLLDIDISWLWDENDSFSLCRTTITPETLEKALSGSGNALPLAVYVTSPDYLGNELDIAALSKVAHKHGVPLLVDNAHGAFLKFLPESRHPMDLGADLCCDSAHKTFPVITGGAYLHISNDTAYIDPALAKQALAQFASTSPSYLILESMDANNAYLDGPYREELTAAVERVAALKKNLQDLGWTIDPSDELKVTIETRSSGYTGTEIADLLAGNDIFVEYADPDYVVLMLTPQNPETDYERLLKGFAEIPQKDALQRPDLSLPQPEVVYTLHHCLYLPREEIPVVEAEDRVLAAATMSCPPAVPAVVCGERISGEAIGILRYYGTKTVWVIKETEEGMTV